MSVMDPDEIVTYAKGIAAALRVIGPTPRDRVLAMLRGLDLDEGDAVVVLDYAVGQGILAADVEHVRVPQERRRVPAVTVTPRSPRKRPAGRPRAAAARAPRLSTADYVLLIEDSDVLRAAMREALEDRGYAVAGAASDAEAMDVIAARGRPCVAFAGLIQPVSEEAALIDRLRAAPGCADLPVVALSAAPALRPRAGTTLLTRPLTAETLVQEIQRFWPARQGSAATGRSASPR
ncbi:MAG: response regulator [Minicystis sp.]